jgi:hypothetical protein
VDCPQKAAGRGGEVGCRGQIVPEHVETFAKLSGEPVRVAGVAAKEYNETFHDEEPATVLEIEVLRGETAGQETNP